MNYQMCASGNKTWDVEIEQPCTKQQITFENYVLDGQNFKKFCGDSYPKP